MGIDLHGLRGIEVDQSTGSTGKNLWGKQEMLLNDKYNDSESII
jgi:hypothetical protein